jgi:integrase
MSNGDDNCWTFPWHRIEYKHMIALRVVLLEEEELAANTVNRLLSATRAVLKQCWKLGQMVHEAYARARDVANVKNEQQQRGRLIKPDEIRKLLQMCDLDAEKGRPSGVRDAAIISILYIAGLRRSEIINLKKADFDVSTGELIIRKGKGNKDRNVFIAGRAKERVIRWLQERSAIKYDALFLTISPYGDLTNQPITSDQTIYDMLSRRGIQAGIDDFSPHDLRRTAISEMWDKGIDGVTIRDTAGHSSMETTANYDRRGDERKKAAADVRDIP